MPVNRRDFVRASALIPFTIWFSRYGFSQTATIRYDVLSLKGQAMVKKYAAAVAKMMDPNQTPKTSPLSWIFQWYTHFVPNSNNASTIQSVYGSTPSPQRSLAQEMWSTCQSHSGQNEDYFLPWHRMYVFFFESIIRAALADNSFTLPYWNYSATGAVHGVIPTAFRSQSDPAFKSLYISNRNTGVNSGTPIDKGQPGALSLESLKQSSYSSNGPVPGFCADLDGKLHGNVHVLVGNSTNMGQVPTAAGDPVFWMHHCNIDRLWASWNKGGRTNPNASTFLSKTFVFADHDGNRIVAKIGDFLDIAALHYTYDRFEPVPLPLHPHAVTGQPIQAATVASATAVSLTPQAVKVPLTRALNAGAITPGGPSGGANYYVVVEDPRINRQPGVLYNLYLNLPDGASPAATTAHLIGTLNFFGAMPRSMGSMQGKFISFDITQLVQRLGAQAVSGDLQVTFAPAGTPESEAQPTVASLKIVRA